MATRTTTASRDPLPETFGELNAMHALRPIRDEVDYDNAVAIVDRLAVLGKPTRDQADYLETLSELVGKYDDEHHATKFGDRDPAEVLRYLLEANDMNASDLGDLLGNRSLGSKILRGERQLSKTHIRALADRFRVSPALFL